MDESINHSWARMEVLTNYLLQFGSWMLPKSPHFNMFPWLDTPPQQYHNGIDIHVAPVIQSCLAARPTNYGPAVNLLKAGALAIVLVEGGKIFKSWGLDHWGYLFGEDGWILVHSSLCFQATMRWTDPHYNLLFTNSWKATGWPWTETSKTVSQNNPPPPFDLIMLVFVTVMENQPTQHTWLINWRLIVLSVLLVSSCLRELFPHTFYNFEVCIRGFWANSVWCILKE